MKTYLFMATALLTFGGPLSAQNGGFAPQKVVVFEDAAQVNLKGIVRFEKRTARLPLPFTPIPGTVEFLPAGDYQVVWHRMRVDTLTQRVPAGNWVEIIRANQDKELTLIYQVGNEYDELVGEVKMLNERDSLVMLRRTGGEEFFLPLRQIRQVMVDTLAVSYVDRKIPQEFAEVGINQDLSFSPLEMECLVEGIRWTPTCRIRILNAKTALVEIGGLLVNPTLTMNEGEVELVPGKILSGHALSMGQSLSAGKLSLKPGDQLNVSLKRIEAEFQEVAECKLPWKAGMAGKNGPVFPVESFFRFKPTQPIPVGFQTIGVYDAHNRLMARVAPDFSGGSLVVSQGLVPDVTATYKDTELKKIGKPVKVEEQMLIKANMESRITITNNGKTGITLMLTRELEGDITDPAKGAVAPGSEAKRTVLTWSLPLNAGEKKELVVLYDLMVPYSE